VPDATFKQINVLLLMTFFRPQFGETDRNDGSAVAQFLSFCMRCRKTLYPGQTK
jgi:hypothetical protein